MKNYTKTETDHILDGIIHALQNLPSWNIYRIVDTVPLPWLECSGVEIAEQLVIRESTLAVDVMTVGVKIAEWGVLHATAQLAWEVEQRRERSWKANLLEKTMTEDEKLPEKDRRKWTEKLQESLYRSSPDYEEWKMKVERAAFAVNCTQAVLEGFRAKKEMLRASIRPAMEGMNPGFAIP